MTDGLVWLQLHWLRPLDVAGPVAAVRALAADQTSPVVVLEVRTDVTGTSYVLGAPKGALAAVRRRLTTTIDNVQVTAMTAERVPVASAGRLKLSTRHRALRTDAPELVVRQLLGAMTMVRKGELQVVQLVLGPRRIPLAVPNQSPSSIVMPWYQAAWMGKGGQVDGEKRAALRDKVSHHGFAATIRFGAVADNPKRRGRLILALYSAIRVSEVPGVQAGLVHDNPRHLNTASTPWRWPLRLNVLEAVAVSGWPVGEDELPGLPPIHPKQVPPTVLAKQGDRIIGTALAPGVTGQLGYSVTDSLRHAWVIGPNGTGKSTLLLNLIEQDLQANRPVVVIEPKDLVSDVLARIPAHRRDDIAILDCTDRTVVGINPLQRHGRSPALVADSLLATFQAIYGDGLGPRSTDILSNSLQALARRDDASLVMLPLLLTNPTFRRSLVAPTIAADPIAAGPFWAWFDHLSDDARSQIIAPLMNKLRPLLRPQLRAVLGQRQPRFNIRDVLTRKKVLLVPLQPGVVGPDAAELLGALVVGELWLALRERVAIPEHRRDPVMIYLDEVQHYLTLGATDLADALATSRSLRASWVLAHQFTAQLAPSMRSAFEANARSRIAFQLNAADARAMAAGQSIVRPEDFSSLPAYHVYASLLRGNTVQPWASGVTLPPPPPCSDPTDIRARSRARYGQSVDAIEADFAALLAHAGDSQPGATGRRRRTS